MQRSSDYIRIVDPAHATTADRAEAALREALPPGQHYLLILVDGPEREPRMASWIGTFVKIDVAMICRRIADSIAS